MAATTTDHPATGAPPPAAAAAPPGARVPPVSRPTLDAWALSRLLVVGVGMVAYLVLGTTGWIGVAFQGPVSESYGPVGNVLAAPFVRWDALFFLSIAEGGYTELRQAAFLPVYPLVVAAVGTVTGSLVVAGVLVSVTAFLGALVLLERLAALELGAAPARRTVLLVALFPASLFFSAVFSESLFLLFTVGAVLAARTDHWAWAGLLGALAAGTRNFGVLVLVPLVLLLLYGPRGALPAPRALARWWPRRPGREALWLALVPLPLLAYMAHTAARLDDPLALFHAQDLWGREFGGPFSALWYGAGHTLGAVADLVTLTDPGNAVQDLALAGVVVLALVATVGCLRRLPVAYGAYAFVALLAALSAPVPENPLTSTPRYVVVVFPLFMWAALVLHDRRAFRAVLAVSVAGLVVATALFASWHWVA